MVSQQHDAKKEEVAGPVSGSNIMSHRLSQRTPPIRTTNITFGGSNSIQ